MEQVYHLALEFRNAMNRANSAGAFNHVPGFHHFPLGSCGDTCYLLAQYLLEHQIYTEYVEGVKWPQSHAWLVITSNEELERKRNIAHKHSSIYACDKSTNGYENVLRIIKNIPIADMEYNAPDYKAELEGRIIIDITGDQFKNSQEFLWYDTPVYVGLMDEMHHLFEINNIHECNGLDGVGEFNSHRLCSLYKEIKKHL